MQLTVLSKRSPFYRKTSRLEICAHASKCRQCASCPKPEQTEFYRGPTTSQTQFACFDQSWCVSF